MAEVNGYNESFNGSLRDELLNGEIFYSLGEAEVLIEAWRRHYTPSDRTAVWVPSWSKFGPAEELLKAGASPHARNKAGATALHMVVKKGSAPERVQMFARYDARSDIVNAHGRSVEELLYRKRDPAYRAAAETMAAARASNQ